jgi:hypothetical protein
VRESVRLEPLLAGCDVIFHLAACTVFTSTRQLYGRPRHISVDETHPINLVDVNAIHMLAAE